MPRYVIERNVGEMTMGQAEVAESMRLSKEVLASMPGTVWIRSYISTVEGKIYCEFDAPDREAILEHGRRAGQRVDRISEIAIEIDPAMFV
jgi:hypothetical protein